MGLFWELFQESQISKRKTENGTLEERVPALEKELDYLEDVLSKAFAELDRLTNGGFDSSKIVDDSNSTQ